MLQPENFPPTPYDDMRIWGEFLLQVGMIGNVSANLFLKYARTVAESGKKSVSPKVAEQSSELALYLRTSSNLRDDSFLRQLRDLKFLLPLPEEELPKSKVLKMMCPAFGSQKPLVSFSEAFSPSVTPLVWTSACVLSADADPSQFTHWYGKDNTVGFKPVPPKNVVAEHLVNVCQSLCLTNKAGDSERLSQLDAATLNKIEAIMVVIYQHLQSHFSDQQLEFIQDLNLPLIFDKKQKAVFRPNQVVVTILEESVVEGLVVRSPETLGRFNDLFRKLGVEDNVIVDHYARALETIHSLTHGNVLNPNDTKLVIRCVDNVFSMLEKNSALNISVPLYLPSEDVSLRASERRFIHIKLTDSKTTIAHVSEKQLRRVKVSGLDVFVGFQALKLYHLDNFSCLPESHRMKDWRDVVKEKLADACHKHVFEDDDTRAVLSVLHSPELAAVVKRLVNHSKNKGVKGLAEDEAYALEKALKNIDVKKTRNLCTVLVVKGEERPETVEQKDFFSYIWTSKEKTSQGSMKFTFYADARQSFSADFSRNDVLLQELRQIVSWAANTRLDALFLSLLKNLSAAQSVMDDEEITPYETQQAGSSVFPDPGTYIPEEFFFLLDNSVGECRIGEVVAYEVGDPLVDSEAFGMNPDTMDDEVTQAGPSQDEEDVNDVWTQEAQSGGQRSRSRNPIYVFAKVLKVIRPAEDQAEDMDDRSALSLLLLRYSICVGPEEQDVIEVGQTSSSYLFLSKLS
jgi:hypothetical protein